MPTRIQLAQTPAERQGCPIGAEVPWTLLRENLGLVAAGAAVALLARAVAVSALLNLIKPLGRPTSARWQNLLVGGVSDSPAAGLLVVHGTGRGLDPVQNSAISSWSAVSRSRIGASRGRLGGIWERARGPRDRGGG
jgi:hypothetical protein